MQVPYVCLPPTGFSTVPPIENRLVANGSQELLRAILKSGGQWQRQQRNPGRPQTGQP